MKNIKRNAFSCFLAMSMLWFACSMITHAAPRVQTTDDIITIVIDPGHGGDNLGTTENGFQEKDMTLKTARAMYDMLCQFDDVEVYMTRTEDRDVDFKERAEYAVSVNADFLFSIHYNASVEHNLFGSEVWISAFPPYNAYGYQFAYIHQQMMAEKGLFLRGIKTKVNEAGKDYYAIIRESEALSLPALIIEHCHVDEERDAAFCDSEEDLAAFGEADALAVARYFGLKSSSLGVDYSMDNTLPEVSETARVQSTLKDTSPPNICMIEMSESNYDTGAVVLTVTAADYDSPLIYYDYSMDGGLTYSARFPWPDSNAPEGTYRDTFSLDITVPSGVQPNFIVRAYNMFDAVTSSNSLPTLRAFLYGEDENIPPPEEEQAAATEESRTTPGTTTFFPFTTGEGGREPSLNFMAFLFICFVIAVPLFVSAMVLQMIRQHTRRKRRRQRRKEAGKSRNHRR